MTAKMTKLTLGGLTALTALAAAPSFAGDHCYRPSYTYCEPRYSYCERKVYHYTYSEPKGYCEPKYSYCEPKSYDGYTPSYRCYSYSYKHCR